MADPMPAACSAAGSSRRFRNRLEGVNGSSAPRALGWVAATCVRQRPRPSFAIPHLQSSHLLWPLQAARFGRGGSACWCRVGGPPKGGGSPEAAMAERQVPAATDNDHSNQTRSLAAAMGTSLRRYWDERTSYQSFLYAAGVLLLASGLVHSVVFLLDGGGWDGPLSWRKPILFGFSFGITVLSLGWVLSFLPRRRRLGWLLAGPLGVASVAEVLLITMQRWRGVPSHFNEATAFDAAVFNAMGGDGRGGGTGHRRGDGVGVHLAAGRPEHGRGHPRRAGAAGRRPAARRGDHRQRHGQVGGTGDRGGQHLRRGRGDEGASCGVAARGAAAAGPGLAAGVHRLGGAPPHPGGAGRGGRLPGAVHRHGGADLQWRAHPGACCCRRGPAGGQRPGVGAGGWWTHRFARFDPS